MTKLFAVVGAGQMGSGIAQVAAQAGLPVLLNDMGLDLAQAGKAKIEKDLSRLVEETDQETAKALKSKLAFPGRKVNPNHADAAKRLDITDPKNTQAREEVYQKKLKAQREKS